MKHDRQKCLYCGKKINRHEWLYGACSDCLKLKAKRKGWKPFCNHDSGMWMYADMAPRMVEYVDPHDMDDRGTKLLYNAINRDTGVFNKPVDYDSMPAWDENGDPIPQKRHNKPMLFRAQRMKALPPIPEGMKKCRTCGKLIPFEGSSRCPQCLERNRIASAKWRAETRNQHKCAHCGKPLEPGYKFKNCPHCKEVFRKAKLKKLQEERGDIIL